MKSAAALVASLAKDPFYQAITIEAGSTSQRTSVLEKYFEYSPLEAQRTGRCVVASTDEGAAAWLLPRTAEVQYRESKEKAAFMAGLLGPRGVANYHSIINFMSPLAEQLQLYAEAPRHLIPLIAQASTNTPTTALRSSGA
jgi:hypothetical protein